MSRSLSKTSKLHADVIKHHIFQRRLLRMYLVLTLVRIIALQVKETTKILFVRNYLLANIKKKWYFCHCHHIAGLWPLQNGATPSTFAAGFGSEKQNSEFSSPPSQLISYFRANSFQHKPDHWEKTPELVLFSWACCLQFSAWNPRTGGKRRDIWFIFQFSGTFHDIKLHQVKFQAL